MGRTYHSIGVSPCSIKYLLHFENGLLPKKPLYADNGDGCADSNTKWQEVSIKTFLFLASLPHRINTRCGLSRFRYSIVAVVKVSQPLPLCDFALCASTVNTVFNNSTPCFCHARKLPPGLAWCPISASISLYILTRLGGIGCEFGTEKANPSAAPGVWYGSCPSITTFTSLRSVANARNTNSLRGKIVLVSYSSCKNFESSLKYGFSNSDFKNGFQLSCML